METAQLPQEVHQVAPPRALVASPLHSAEGMRACRQECLYDLGGRLRGRQDGLRTGCQRHVKVAVDEDLEVWSAPQETGKMSRVVWMWIVELNVHTTGERSKGTDTVAGLALLEPIGKDNDLL